jgi:hypothetical protein
MPIDGGSLHTRRKNGKSCRQSHPSQKQADDDGMKKKEVSLEDEEVVSLTTLFTRATSVAHN